MRFIVYGKPVGKQRPRFNSRTRIIYTPGKTKGYENAISNACYEHMLKQGLKITKSPCIVRIEVMVSVPKSYSKKRREYCICGTEKPNKKPDIDNIAKTIMDGLNGVAYEDDKQVVRLEIEKHYWEHEDAVYIEINTVN